MEGLKAIVAPHLIRVINSHPELVGCQIHYRSEETGEVVISLGNPSSPNAKMIVILEKNGSRTNRSFLMKELTSVTINCGMATLSATAVAGGVAASGFTGGAAIGVSIVAWSGFVASGLKCSNSIGRSLNSVFDPNSNNLYELDNDDTYKKAIEGLELANKYIGYVQLPISLSKLLTKYRMIDDVKLFATLPHNAKKKALKQLLTKMSKSSQGKIDLEKFYKELGIDIGEKIQGLSFQQVKDISSKISSQLHKTDFRKALNTFISKKVIKEIGKNAIGMANENDEINNFIIHIVSP